MSAAAWGSTKYPAMAWPLPSSSEHPSSSNPVRFVQRMRPSGSTQQKATGACSRNSTSSSSRLGWPLEAGKAVAHQFRRAARLATTVISSAGCTGLERCSWKPARSARRRSSVRA